MSAFEAALVQHGAQGASFARIAAIGGFHRSLIQHHFGSRERLMRAYLDRLVGRYAERLRGLQAQDAPLEALVDWLLSPFGADGPPLISRAVDALVAVAPVEPTVQQALLRLYTAFADALQALLCERYPHASPEACAAVAFSVVCLSFGRGGMEALGMPGAREGWARDACRALIAGLAD